MTWPPDEQALLLAAAVGQGDEAAAADIWQSCNPRAQRDLAMALAGLLLLCWEENPAMLDRIEARLIAGQN